AGARGGRDGGLPRRPRRTAPRRGDRGPALLPRPRAPRRRAGARGGDHRLRRAADDRRQRDDAERDERRPRRLPRAPGAVGAPARRRVAAPLGEGGGAALDEPRRPLRAHRDRGRAARRPEDPRRRRARALLRLGEPRRGGARGPLRVPRRPPAEPPPRLRRRRARLPRRPRGAPRAARDLRRARAPPRALRARRARRAPALEHDRRAQVGAGALPAAPRLSAAQRRRLAACAALALAIGAGAPDPVASREPAVPGAKREVRFMGMCDASAAVALSPRLFAVADAASNALRSYDADRGGAAVWSADLSAALDLPPRAAKGSKKSEKPARPPRELDLEAGARVGDRAYWLTSHGRNASGKERPERQRFFATQLPREGAPLALVGSAYASLLADLLAEPRLAALPLAEAAAKAPTHPGRLAIHGHAARREAGPGMGFGNPVPDAKALLVPLLDPDEVVSGGRARFGDPLRLELGGLGVRALARWHGRTLIVAGHTDSRRPSRLYTWDGR